MEIAMRLLAKLCLAATLFFCATGYTECEYFTQVPVPAVDNTRPTNAMSVWTGEHEQLTLDDSADVHYVMDDPNQTVMAMAAAYDNGGVRSVRMTWGATYKCCKQINGTNVCSVESEPTTGHSEDAQAGSVGSTVSNGMWLAEGVTPSSFCPSSEKVDDFYFGWSLYSEDFAGNRTETHRASISYVRP
jgi:VCBS repeat-containing protein